MQRFSILHVILFSAISAPICSPVLAQTVPPPAQGAKAPAVGACGGKIDLPDKLSAAKVDDFRSDPQSLLKHNPIGGLALSSEVKGLTITDPASAVDALLDAASSSNSMQAVAIGTGLGQAVKAMMGVDKACADEIARKITSVGLTDLLSGYRMAQADTQAFLTGADEGIGGGLGGAVNGSSTASTGSSGATSRAGGSTSTSNSPETFNFSGSTGSCSSSVSPRRRC